MSQACRAIVAGHICLDIIPGLDKLPAGQFETNFRPGQMILIGEVTISTGGPVSNTGLALHKLGIPTQLMGKIGDDLFGRAVVNVISSFDCALATGMVVDPASSTSYTLIISPPGVDRLFLHNVGANDTFCASDVDYAKLVAADLFHFGYPPVMRRMYENHGAELVELYRRAKNTGVITSLDMTFPDLGSPGGQADWRAILGATLPYVDVFLPSIEEILVLLYREKYDEIVKRAGGSSLLDLVTPELLSEVSGELLRMGVKIVGLKLGHRGLYLHTASVDKLRGLGRRGLVDASQWADHEMWTPCFQVDVVGTTGSGDSTIAGFLSGLLRGLDPYQTMTAAVAVGACNVEAADALGGLRTWEDTLKRVASGWTRHKLVLHAPGWQWHEDRWVWEKSLPTTGK